MPARDFTLTTTAAALRAGVAHAASVTDERNTVPILGHLLLKAGCDGLALTGTDRDRQATARVVADVEGTGAITVPARTLDDVTAKLPAEASVTLRADAEAGLTHLQCGRARFKLMGLDPADFPEFAPEHVAQGFPHAIELAGKTLADVIGRCQFAISKEETRYYLNGIYAHVVDGAEGPRLRLVATDGHRLARIDTPHAQGLDPAMPGVIIPRTIVPKFAKLAKAAGEGTVTLSVSANLVQLTAGTTDLTSRLIDGTFPDYGRVIPSDFIREVRAPTLELIAALERVRVMADDKVNGVKLSFADGTLNVGLRRPHDLFEAYDEVDVEVDGPDGAISFNAGLLAEILAQTGGDTVRLKLGDAEAPAVIGDRLAEGLYVLMPLRPGSIDAGGA